MSVSINWAGTRTGVSAQLEEWGRSVSNPAIDRARAFLLAEVANLPTNGVQVVANVPEPGEVGNVHVAVKPMELLV